MFSAVARLPKQPTTLQRMSVFHLQNWIFCAVLIEQGEFEAGAWQKPGIKNEVGRPSCNDNKAARLLEHLVVVTSSLLKLSHDLCWPP